MNARYILAVAPALLGLAACADFPGSTAYLDELNATTPTGSPFTQALAANYKDFANDERNEHDWFAQQLYGHKGLDAAQGQVDAPEAVADHSIDDANAAAELTSARERLMTDLATDAPTRDPANAAKAQVQYECWLHEQHEGWQTDEINACRSGFMAAIAALEAKPAAMAPAPAPATAGAPAPAAAPTTYLVFFDFDKSNIKPEAEAIIKAAADAIKAGHIVKIKVTGYTDTVGTVQYNMRLSYRRADSVQSELVRDGVPAADITVDGKGKTDLLVPTADGVREPKNRRAVIDLAPQ